MVAGSEFLTRPQMKEASGAYRKPTDARVERSMALVGGARAVKVLVAPTGNPRPRELRVCLVDASKPRPKALEEFLSEYVFDAGEARILRSGLDAAIQSGAAWVALVMIHAGGDTYSTVSVSGDSPGRVVDSVAYFVAHSAVDACKDFGGLVDMTCLCDDAGRRSEFVEQMGPALRSHFRDAIRAADEMSLCHVCAIHLDRPAPHQLWPWIQKRASTATVAALRQSLESAHAAETPWLAVLATEVPSLNKVAWCVVIGRTLKDVVADAARTHREVVNGAGMPDSVGAQFKPVAFSHCYDELSAELSGIAGNVVRATGVVN